MTLKEGVEEPSQRTFTYSKSAKATLQNGLKYAQ